MNLAIMENWLSSYYAYLWYFGYAGCLVLFGFIENFFPFKAYTCPVVKRYLTNLSLLVVDATAQRLILPIFPITAAIYFNDSVWAVFHLLPINPIVTFCLAFLVVDLAGYFFHKAMHYYPLLWRVHHTHHTDIDFDVTTDLRFHPFESLLTTMLEIILVIIFGIPAVAVMIFTLIHIVHGLFTHLNVSIPSRLDTALKLFIVTPNMHRIHHSVRMDESSSNYGIVFSSWDRLFETYKKEPIGGHEHMLLGLENYRDPERNMIFEFLMLPFKPVGFQTDDKALVDK